MELVSDPSAFPGNSGSFIKDHVFPDSELVPIGEMTSRAERVGWEIRDIENLRLHYAYTPARMGPAA